MNMLSSKIFLKDVEFNVACPTCRKVSPFNSACVDSHSSDSSCPSCFDTGLKLVTLIACGHHHFCEPCIRHWAAENPIEDENFVSEYSFDEYIGQVQVQCAFEQEHLKQRIRDLTKINKDLVEEREQNKFMISMMMEQRSIVAKLTEELETEKARRKQLESTICGRENTINQLQSTLKKERNTIKQFKQNKNGGAASFRSYELDD